LRQNGADHESREHDDRHCAPADLFQMMHNRREAQPPRMRDRAERRQHQRAEKLHDQHQRAADLGDVAADGIERDEDRVGRGPLFEGHLIDRPQLRHQRAIGFRKAGDAGGRATPEEGSLQPLDQPRAEGVQPLEAGEVDVDRARAGMPAARVFDQAFELGGALHRPGAGSKQRDMIAFGRSG
jgi:hypothetical protein